MKTGQTWNRKKGDCRYTDKGNRNKGTEQEFNTDSRLSHLNMGLGSKDTKIREVQFLASTQPRAQPVRHCQETDGDINIKVYMMYC